MNLKEVTFSNIIQLSDEIINNKIDCLIEEESGNHELSYKYLAMNLPIIAILNKYEIPITADKLILGNFSNEPFYDKMTEIYETIIEKYNDPTLQQSFGKDVWYAVNFINNFIMTHCRAHQYSLDVENLVKIKNHPEIKAILETPLDKRSSVAKIENQVDTVRNRLMKKLSVIDVPENQLKLLIDLKLINEGQLGHLFYLIGFRTDLADKTISKLIGSNYLDGLKEPIDIITENLSDKKSKLYNKLLMPMTQYSNRKQQLAAFGLKNVYDHDCGTQVYVDFYITENVAKATLGKWIRKDNKLIMINRNNLPSLINQVVQMRSAMACRHTDGLCTVCGGKLTKFYMNRFFNIGHCATLIFTNKTSQAVLGSKHHQTTSSVEYVLPEELEGLLVKRGRLLYLHNPKLAQRIEIGLNIKDATKLLNISKVSSGQFQIDEDIFEANFGMYKTLSIRKSDTKEEIVMDVSLSHLNTLPKLTKSFIRYLLKRPDCIKAEQDKLYIRLDEYKNGAIFNVAVTNISINEFYDRIENFSKKTVGSYTNISSTLNEFASIVYTNSNINIVYTELLLRSLMIENDINRAIPVVESEDASFSFITDINMFRGIGTSLAFQGHQKFLRSPEYYLVPKNLTGLDVFLNFNI